MDKPVLSIGIIFKNDIRCIERCLKALQPLRDAVSCELVMVDTGSEDGSRAVAEKYADILADFSWINDFAAARNAVLERCSGQWYLTVDTDEYMDGDVSEIVDFLGNCTGVDFCQVVIRNYDSYEMDGAYSDFFNLRMVRASTGSIYEGKIHERWTVPMAAEKTKRLRKTIFHHDGYVGKNPEKARRNMTLLREKMQEDPGNLLVRLQVIESGVDEPDFQTQLRKAVSMIKKKTAGWQMYGPPIMRYAVIFAEERHMPEHDKWVKMAESWFPDSYHIRIDVSCHLLNQEFSAQEYAACISRGEKIMSAYSDFRAGRGDISGLMFSTVRLGSPYHEYMIRLLLANAYLEEKQPEKTLELLEDIDYTLSDEQQTSNLAKTLCNLHSRSTLDTAPLIRRVWEAITSPEPSQKKADLRRNMFLLISSAAFSEGYWANERTNECFCRQAYTLFLPLAGKCPLGTAAAMMQEDDPARLAELVETIEMWGEMSTPALAHALEKGMPFPLPGRPMNLEEMDALAGRLASDKRMTALIHQAANMIETADWQQLGWTRGLILATVGTLNWKGSAAETGLAIAQDFIRIEREFLSRCYTSAALCEENIMILPPMHRFGWYCVQAFTALDSGDAVGYVRLLRKGLDTAKDMKPMVEFLTEHTPQLQEAKPADELLALAEKVRSMLAIYPSDDPAVEIIKQSPAYQKVVHLIEGPELGLFGGLKQ